MPAPGKKLPPVRQPITITFQAEPLPNDRKLPIFSLKKKYNFAKLNIVTPLFYEVKGARQMSNKVTFDYSKASSFISDHEVESMKKLALDAKEVLVSKTGAGNDFL